MNSNKNKRMYILVALIVCAALTGTFMIDTNPVVADSVGGVKGAENGLDETAKEAVGSVLPSIFKMLSALVVVLFALYGSVYLLKKGMGKKFASGKNGCALEVLESTFVAPRKTVSLLRVADRAVLIGITDQQISVLTELSVEQTAELQKTQTEIPASVGFTEILASASKKVKDFRLYRGHSAAEA